MATLPVPTSTPLSANAAPFVPATHTVPTITPLSANAAPFVPAAAQKPATDFEERISTLKNSIPPNSDTLAVQAIKAEIELLERVVAAKAIPRAQRTRGKRPSEKKKLAKEHAAQENGHDF